MHHGATGQRTPPYGRDTDPPAFSPEEPHEPFAPDASIVKELVAVTEAEVQTPIVHCKAKLHTGERLSLLAIMPANDGPVVQEMFSRCRPRDGSHANPLFENKQKLQKRFQETFEQPLEQAIADIAGLGDAATSPIIKSLYHLATWPAFLKEAASQRDLIIISDLLEYSDVVSHYQPAYKWSDVLKSPWIDKLENKLSGVDVTVHLRTNARTQPYHRRTHERFWEAYMQHARVGHYRVDPF
jgi:hypothetical protein